MEMVVAFLLLLAIADTLPGDREEAIGIVVDTTGLPVSGAIAELYSVHGMQLARALTGEDGRFRFRGLRQGSYLLEVRMKGFQTWLSAVSVQERPPARIHRVELSPHGLHTEISVTASPGSVEHLKETAQLVAVSDRNKIQLHGHPTVAGALAGLPGIHLQQSAVGQASPFLRGLTGFHVLNMVDGVRFNNSTFRFGPNQYLAFLEPSQAGRVEATLGPASSEYGSDSLGGSIHFLTPVPRFSESSRWRSDGGITAFFGSGDLSSGSAGRLSFGNDRVAAVAGAAWRHHNDLRPGGGFDSHHVFRRLLGLSGPQIRDLLGSRLRETSFSQHGGHLRLCIRLGPDQQLTLSHQHSAQRGVRGYKDLWGGLGRLQSAFTPQSLDLFYLRHEKQELGVLDSLASTFSINSQRDGAVSQGLRLSDAVRADRTRVNAFGYAAQARAHRGRHQSLFFGGEFHDEHIDSSRLLIPVGAKYRMLGLYGQTGLERPGRRLKVTAGSRMTAVWFGGRGFHDVTFNTAVTVGVTEKLRAHMMVARGFRAPNVNDLGTIGLQDLGFEFPAEAVAAAGGLIGSNSGESAFSTGRIVKPLGSERLFNYEAGFGWQGEKTYLRAQFFDAELYDAIARRTVLFRTESVPREIAGITVRPSAASPAQAAQGVTGVATDLDSRSVKAFVNVGRQRYAGMELLLEKWLSAALALSAQYAFLAGRELDPGGPVRRLPPQQGMISLRLRPPGRWWAEFSLEASGRQRRMSGGDVSDERMGAERSRLEIAAFFNGDRMKPFLRNGVFWPTGETLEEIQLRVLPSSLAVRDDTRVALYNATPGYAALHVAAGYQATERTRLTISARNLTDRNYRHHGSGVDAPGRHLILSWEFRF